MVLELDILAIPNPDPQTHTSMVRAGLEAHRVLAPKDQDKKKGSRAKRTTQYVHIWRRAFDIQTTQNTPPHAPAFPPPLCSPKRRESCDLARILGVFAH